MEPPFYGDNLITLGYNIVHKFPKPLSNSYSPKLISLVMKFLEKNPSTRPKISEVLDIFPSRYRHPIRMSSNEYHLQSSTNPSNSSNAIENIITAPTSDKKTDRIETYKGNSVKLLRIDDKNFKPDNEKDIVVKRSNLLNAPNSFSNNLSNNPSSPKRPSTSIGLSSKTNNIINQIREKEESIPSLKKMNILESNKISNLGSEQQTNKLDLQKTGNVNPSGANELPELKQQHVKKAVDTESTVENKPKIIQVWFLDSL